MADQITDNHAGDGIDRRGFLKCMAWAGTGLLWTMSGGVLAGCSSVGAAAGGTGGDWSFAQISDSHIGFHSAPNQDVTATFQQAIGQINALSATPAFLLHTGDLTHLSKPDQFDTVDQSLKSSKAGQIYYVPGEHDVIGDNGKAYLDRYGKGTSGGGWQSFDYKGVHFIGLVNVLNLQAGGMGRLGADQLAWLQKDLEGRTSSTPVVVFAHIPLWTVYPQWGWGTDDSEQALTMLKRFGSLTVLNGHIHQILQKVEGNVTFHTARSTAFPQPVAGTAPAPGPIKDVPADRLRSMLGVTSVSYVERTGALAMVDSTLG
jgi:Icc protein